MKYFNLLVSKLIYKIWMIPCQATSVLAGGSTSRRCSVERMPRARDERSGQRLRDENVTQPWGRAGGGESG